MHVSRLQNVRYIYSGYKFDDFIKFTLCNSRNYNYATIISSLLMMMMMMI